MMPASTMLPLDLDVCQKASRYATRVCQEMTKRSSLIKDLKVDCLPYFERDEILPFLGDKLGKGGFNSVYELEKIELDETSNVSEEQRQQRAAVAHGLGRKLAVKFLNESAMANSNEFCNGAADLLLEAKYLSALSNHPHPSIISLHGVAAAGAAGFATGQMGGYFLIVDRLYDTLDKRIDVWKELRRRKLRHSSPLNTKLLQAMFLQRLMVACDICSAIRHLHSLNVVFRDLKPDKYVIFISRYCDLNLIFIDAAFIISCFVSFATSQSLLFLALCLALYLAHHHSVGFDFQVWQWFFCLLNLVSRLYFLF